MKINYIRILSLVLQWWQERDEFHLHLKRLPSIANCRNVRGLERVSYIDLTENLNISTEPLLNEKLPSQV